MRYHKEVSLFVIAGKGMEDEADIRLNVECSRDCTPHRVATVGTEHTIDDSVEYVLRVAAVLNRLRADHGDTRSVCADHGYYEADTSGECPKCAAMREYLEKKS